MRTIKRRAAAIDHRIGELGGDDLAPQPVRLQRVRVTLGHLLREIAVQLAAEIGIVRHVAVEQFAVERQLGVGEQHRELGPRQRRVALAPLGERHLVRQVLDGAVEFAALLEDVHQPLLEAEVLQAAPLRQRERQRLLVVVAQHQPRRPRRSSRRAARCGPRCVSAPARTGVDSAILMLTSTSEVLTPAELSMASVLSRMPRSAASMRPRCVMPRLAPSPIDLAVQVGAGDADRVVGAVADRVVGLGRGADIGADAAEEQQIDLGLEDRLHQRLRRDGCRGTPNSFCASGDSWISFDARG